MNPQLYGQFIYDKAGKNIQWKRQSFQQMVLGKLDHFLVPYTKINPKWMKDLNGRQETFKILEGNTGRNLFNMVHSKFLLDLSPEARETKKNKLLGVHQNKKLLHSEGNKTKRHPVEWEKIFANDISDKWLISKVYKEFIKLNITTSLVRDY